MIYVCIGGTAVIVVSWVRRQVLRAWMKRQARLAYEREYNAWFEKTSAEREQAEFDCSAMCTDSFYRELLAKCVPEYGVPSAECDGVSRSESVNVSTPEDQPQ